MSTENPIHEREAIIHDLTLQYRDLNQNIRKELIAFDSFVQVAMDTLTNEGFSSEKTVSRVNELNSHFARMKEFLLDAIMVLLRTHRYRESICTSEENLPEIVQQPLRELKRFLDLHNFVSLIGNAKYEKPLAPIADEGEKLALAHEDLKKTLEEILGKEKPIL